MIEANQTSQLPKILIRTRNGRVLGLASWVYALVVLVALAMIRWVGGGWWGVCVLLFMPRWLLLAPIVFLALLCLFRRAFGPWIVQAATAIVVLGPLMGLNLPIARYARSIPRGDRIRLVTYNLGMSPLPAHLLVAWLDARQIDVVCFQEGGREEDAIRKALREAGWRASKSRAVVSRLPIIGEMPPLPDAWEGEERFGATLERVRLRGRSGVEFVVASVHLPTIRPGLQRLIQQRNPAGLKRQIAWWRTQLGRVLSAIAEVNDVPLVLAGDFNMPADDAAVAALQQNFRFAFDEAGWGYGYTRPTEYPWVRIDHILTAPDCGIISCHVGPDFGSDHLPIWAEIALPK